VGALQTAILAAVAFPEKQHRVQEELDNVVGKDRLPSFDDMDYMPYTVAYMKEILRWRPIAATGFAHRAMQDEPYLGYVIPKGAHLLGNIWNLHRDPAYFQNADEFQPERYLEGNSKDNWKLNDLPHFAFGHGRRVCPGNHIAERSIFINVATCLWAFDWAAPIDSTTGKPRHIDTTVRGGFVPVGFPYPKPFECVITQRIPNLEDMLGEEDLLVV